MQLLPEIIKLNFVQTKVTKLFEKDRSDNLFYQEVSQEDHRLLIILFPDEIVQELGFYYNLTIGFNINIKAMPYAYKCQVKESPVHGKGLFACEDIPKGAVYWAWELPNPKPLVGYEEKPNRVFTREQLEKMENKEELTEILHKGFYYADLDVYIDLNDGTQYNNHSDDWNSQIIYDQGKDLKKLTCIVRKEVKAGDQLTAYYGNYMSNQAQWVKDLTLKYNPKRMDLENHVEQTGNKAKNWKIE